MILNLELTDLDTDSSIREMASRIKNIDLTPVLTILFVSSNIDLKKVESALDKYHISGELIACTTSGEIAPGGIREGKMVCQVYFNDEFCAKTFPISNLSQINNEENIIRFSKLNKYIKKIEKGYFGSAKSFGILLVDGLSIKEEGLCEFISNCLGTTPVIGGSAGDDTKFEETFLLTNGSFCKNTALLTIVTTTRGFKTFKAQHFIPNNQKVVITGADPTNRVVSEINGIPAGQQYAQMLGLKKQELSPAIFSKYPLMLKIGDEYFVRSIQKLNPEDDSLTFYCAIDKGLVLTLADKERIADSNQTLQKYLEKEIGEIESCLLFECILRKLEILSLDKIGQDEVTDFYKKNNAVGFYTYGEQFSHVHINQTITGVAFGKR